MCWSFFLQGNSVTLQPPPLFSCTGRHFVSLNYILQNERNDQFKIALKLATESTGNKGRNVGKTIIFIKDSPADFFFLAKSFK